MQTYKPSPPCTCAAAPIYEKGEKMNVYTSLLWDLMNPDLEVVSSIELPDIGKVYAKVI